MGRTTCQPPRLILMGWALRLGCEGDRLLRLSSGDSSKLRRLKIVVAALEVHRDICTDMGSDLVLEAEVSDLNMI